jgi:hypothetical protein
LHLKKFKFYYCNNKMIKLTLATAILLYGVQALKSKAQTDSSSRSTSRDSTDDVSITTVVKGSLTTY